MKAKRMKPETMLVTLIACVVCLLAADKAQAQVVYVPVRHPVYDYLDRIETKYGMQTIQFARPLPRMEVAAALAAVYTKSALATYDKRELEFYFREFAEELTRLNGVDTTKLTIPDPRWNLVQVLWDGSIRNYFAVDLIGSARYEIRDGDFYAGPEAVSSADNFMKLSNGITAYGYAGEHLGAGMTWYDNHITGKPYAPRAERDPEQGIVKGPGVGSSYAYEVAEGQFTYSIPMFRIGIDKLDAWRGSGRFGGIVLSDHVPSFPKIGFNLQIADWLQFEYFHAWLFSDNLDPIRTVIPEGSIGQLKFYESKYFVSHSISARPMKNLEVTLGESIIYSGGDVNVLFLIPVISFRAADRWTRATTGNSQFYADFRYSPVNGFMVYGTGFIDEMDLSKILGNNPIDKDYHIAYTIGLHATDLYSNIVPVANETRLEFSRTYPYTYTNTTVLQQYASHQVQMGHWIGANADIVTIEHTVHPLQFLRASLTASYARFGNQTDPLQPPPRTQPAFLFDHEYSTATVTGKLQWRPIHGAAVWGAVSITELAIEESFIGTPVPDGISIGGGISYGLQ